MATIGELMRRRSELDAVSATPGLDVELLLSTVLGCDRVYLFTWPERELTGAQTRAFDGLLQRRRAGEPVAYILGRKAFWTLNLAVSPATLIPRPETELLVELALSMVDAGPARVLDLGTGSGAIALALAVERPAWRILAVDRVPEALQLARQNLDSLALGNVELSLGDWFDGVEGRFDLVVSNPPYVEAEDVHLERGDLRFEPRSALVAPEAGLADIARIIDGAERHLAAGGRLLLEHGAGQAEPVRRMLTTAGFRAVTTWRDLAGLERVSAGRRPEREAHLQR